MPRLENPKKANTGKEVKCGRCGRKIAVGEKYFKWSTRLGRSSSTFIRCKDHRPRQSEMTQSEHKAAAYEVQEAIEDAVQQAREDQDIDALKTTLEEQGEQLESYKDDTLADRISNLEGAFPSGCPALETLQEYDEQFGEFKENIDSAVSEIDSAWDVTKDVDFTFAIGEEEHAVSLSREDITVEIGEGFDFAELDFEVPESEQARFFEEANARREELLQEMVDECCDAADQIDCPL